MPQIEIHSIEKDLKQNKIWPVYWCYGSESWKSRRLLDQLRQHIQRIKKIDVQVIEEDKSFKCDTLEKQVLSVCENFLLGEMLPFLVIKDAHLIESLDFLKRICGLPLACENLQHLCVFLTKDWDARKKISKLLLERAAVVPCQDVEEGQRESWIRFLAQEKKIKLLPEVLGHFSCLEPWSLGMIERELEKIEIGFPQEGVFTIQLKAQIFVESFMMRDLKQALIHSRVFSETSDESFLVLGLLGWNIRYLLFLVTGKGVSLSSYVLDKLKRWKNQWSVLELQSLQRALVEFDYQIKQLPLTPLGLWTDLVIRFCKA